MKIRLPIGTKLILSHFLAVLLVSGSVGTYFYFSAVESLLRSLQARLQNSAALVSQALDARDFAEIRTESDVSMAAYADALETLRRFRRTNPDIAFLYVMRRVEDQVLFVVDSDETERQALPGRPYRTAPQALLAGFSRPSVDGRIWEDEWGAFMSGYAPLRNGEGEYLVGLDMQATEVRNKLRQIRTAGVLSLTGSILLAILFSRLLSSQLITPIRLLIDRCSAIAAGRLDKSIDLSTGDELDQLIQSFNAMSGHLGESREQNRKTEEALKRARDTQELRVDERTRELQELNEKLLHEIGERKKAEEALAMAARSDSLTGTLNRRAILEHLHYQAVQFERNRSPFAVMLCDIDHFKPINDNFGHDAGDKVLTAVADRLRKAVRKQDLVARWGGEEFLMMLPETDLKGALQVAEKMLSTVESDVFLAGSHELKLTLSVGVCVYSAGQAVDECIKAADKALYQAKHQGRNRAVAAR